MKNFKNTFIPAFIAFVFDYLFELVGNIFPDHFSEIKFIFVMIIFLIISFRSPK